MDETSPKTGDLEIGRRIADRRDELGLSRRDLAAEAGLSYSYVAQIETGYRLPSIKQQWTIARVLGSSLDELFGTDDAPPPAAPPPLGESPRAARPRASVEEAIEHAAGMLESLPASVRLDALAKVQMRIIQGVALEKPSGEWR